MRKKIKNGEYVSKSLGHGYRDKARNNMWAKIGILINSIRNNQFLSKIFVVYKMNFGRHWEVYASRVKTFMYVNLFRILRRSCVQ